MTRPPFSKELFAAHRQARRGGSNPERMDNPVWAWLVRTRLSAYQAATAMGERTGIGMPPGWCFNRFGCSKTVLDDGRVIRVAGEHEDHYDPDFFIYNDVVVTDPDGSIAIYGYPVESFPPTDFHTATRAGDSLYVVGNLGYVGERQHGVTPVFRLDLDSFSFARAPSAPGGGPGWIHQHTAALSDDGETIILSRGIVEQPGPEGPIFVDNIDDWAYRLCDGSWHRLTERPWQEWVVRRVDGEPLCLFEMSCMAFEAEMGERFGAPHDIGTRRFDPELYAALYQPPVEHEPEPRSLEDDTDDDGYRPGDNTRYDEARLRVGDARVRYAITDRRTLAVKVEGGIDEAALRTLLDDLRTKLERLQGVSCRAASIRP